MKSKILLTLLLCIFLLTSLFAQIKIGTNPTSIEANSNLEIEASTAGRKVVVDKTTGQVTIADGTQENAKVLMTNADGKTSWKKIGTESIIAFPRGSSTGASTTTLENGVPQILNYPNFEQAITSMYIDSEGLKILTSGQYQVETNLVLSNSEGCTGTSFMSIAVSPTINGVVYATIGTDDRMAPVFNENFKSKTSVFLNLTSFDLVKFSIVASIISPQAGCTTKVVSGGIRLAYLP